MIHPVTAFFRKRRSRALARRVLTFVGPRVDCSTYGRKGAPALWQPVASYIPRTENPSRTSKR